MQKGDIVFNSHTGICGTVLGIWDNRYSKRTIVNVLPDGAARADWQMWDSQVVCTEPAIDFVIAVQVLDEVLVTGNGTDAMHATVLSVYEDSVFVHLTDFDEYVMLDRHSILRNLTRGIEKTAA